LYPQLEKDIRDSYQSVGETMVAGGVKDMEQYKYLLGQAHALQLIDQEISNLLNPKEDKKNEQRDKTSSNSGKKIPKTKLALEEKYQEENKKKITLVEVNLKD
jgi:ribonucleotide reductase alpha subunit